MSKNNKIVVCADLDAVIANFSSAAAKRLNIQLPKNTILPETYLYDQVSSKSFFWSKIRGYDFWANEILPYEWSKDLIKVIDDNVENWIFLSKPSCDSDCLKAKYDWVKKHFKLERKLWLATNNKEFFSGPNKILIDDKKDTCEKWALRGGFGYHWPEMTEDIDRKEIDDRLEKLDKFLKSFN